MIKKLFLFFSLLFFLGVLGVAGGYYYAVVLHPGEQIKTENIKDILGKESPVFYNDGKSRLGVFFDEAHRQYVPYDMIPVNFINGLVASEDDRFFYHFGFDIIGILRAAVKNIQSGRIVQGGSTLTQQTAKNLFKRKDRSIKAKLKELLFALRLEYHYSKEYIFEFYANQFYVSGNGHGLGVAARYYFNKKPEELSLVECAYIAGSVKRPNYYNPFIKKNVEAKAKALERGRARTNYVLGKMAQLGMISDYQYNYAKNKKIVFKKGRVGYSMDYVMEMVRDAVSSTEVVEAMEKHDITNISTSGVRIITTVDKELQDKALYALRHDLSRLDVRLRGYEREEVQEELKDLDYKGDSILKVGGFFFGEIKEISYENDQPVIEVSLGRNKGSGIIPRNGLKRLVKARVRFQKLPWSEVKKKDYVDFLHQLKQGDRVWVSLKRIDENKVKILDLEKFPQLNGGALVIKDGQIMAMAGGVENRFYNRAIYARRTMGSSYKPFVFAAAMQLGWNGADLLRNSRDVFVFQNQPYFPRPDHHSPHEYVSMSWAGVYSENVASVWLLTHLCDKMNLEELVEVASKVDLAPRSVDGDEEPYSRFRSRIRDRYGIIVNKKILRKAAYQQAVNNIETDLLFIGRDLDYGIIKKLHYGLNFADFYEDIDQQLKDETKKLTKSMKKELKLRKTILRNNFLHMEALFIKFTEKRRELLSSGFSSGMSDEYSSYTADERIQIIREEPHFYFDDSSKKYCFIRQKDRTASMIEIGGENLHNYLLSLDENQKNDFFNNIYLDNFISIESFQVLVDEVGRELNNLEKQLPYSMETLSKVEDYRILVGLKYLILLARETGINSDLEPVLSFPLGSNVVTLLETLRMYEGLVTGEVVTSRNNDDENDDLLCILERIENADGEVLYTPDRYRKRVFNNKTTIPIGHILENIVKYGTGRFADRNVKLIENDPGQESERLKKLGLSIPVLGKTGTANRYTNASFFGFLPELTESKDKLSVEDGYGIGVYVGYDDNKEMRKGVTKISGAAGALPIWTDIVNAIVDKQEYTKYLDPVDLSFDGLGLTRGDIGQLNVGVAKDGGGIVPTPAQNIPESDRYNASILTFGSINGFGVFSPEKNFHPFWRVSHQENAPQN